MKKKLKVNIYYYVDEETGKKIFDTDSMIEEFTEKLIELTGDDMILNVKWL